DRLPLGIPIAVAGRIGGGRLFIAARGLASRREQGEGEERCGGGEPRPKAHGSLYTPPYPRIGTASVQRHAAAVSAQPPAPWIRCARPSCGGRPSGAMVIEIAASTRGDLNLENNSVYWAPPQ